jgi:hypothetical protein
MQAQLFLKWGMCLRMNLNELMLIHSDPPRYLLSDSINKLKGLEKIRREQMNQEGEDGRGE